MPDRPSPTTIGALRASGHEQRTVKQEVRANLVQRLRDGDELFPGLHGFDDTVLPELERALLAGHDLILLGERGQAKTRIVRSLLALLDEWTPVIDGCELRSHPYEPLSAHALDLVAEHGDETAVTWLGREERFSEKLATPDISVGDLVGDVDPIRVAEGRYLADVRTIHFGLLPRTNRGIFAVNELPDLAERVQVALLNVLEERDVQVRGYTFRLPLDVLLVATANPDDYTNRGRIISPLKDRFGAQVRTHYPVDRATEIAIARQESTPPPGEVSVVVPDFLDEVLAELTRELRRSQHVNHRSGVSVRFTIGARETMIASAVRRAVRTGRGLAVPRIVDLWPVVPAAIGRVEFDTLEEGHELQIVADHLRRAILTIFRERLLGVDLDEIVDAFDEGLVLETSDLTPSEDVLGSFDELTLLPTLLAALDAGGEAPDLAASAIEFALEGLHLGRRLNKDELGAAGWRFAQ